jgi:LEA14-like dessication related protein
MLRRRPWLVLRAAAWPAVRAVAWPAVRAAAWRAVRAAAWRAVRAAAWLAVPAAAYLAACSLVVPHFEKPEVSVASIQLLGGNLLQQNFLVTFNVQNPNDRALPVTGLHAELNVAGERLASGVSNGAFTVPPHGVSQFDMTITANMAVVLLKLSQRSDPHAAAIDYEMTGSASIDLPFLRDLPFHQTGSFPLGSK